MSRLHTSPSDTQPRALEPKVTDIIGLVAANKFERECKNSLMLCADTAWNDMLWECSKAHPVIDERKGLL
jgi:hypothetical protein